MRATWLIARKDLRLRVRDRSLLTIGLLAPLALSLIFSFVFGTLDEDSDLSFDVGVVDLDDGDVGAGFVDVLGTLEGDGLLEVHTYDDEAAARAAVDSGEVSASAVVPPGLSAAVRAGSATEVLVVGDVDATIATNVLGSVARGYLTSVRTGTLAAGVSVATGVVAPDRAAEVAREVATGPPAVEVGALEARDRTLDPTARMVAGLSMFFVYFVAGLAVTGTLQERDLGTLARLLAAPIPRASILGGKALAAVITGVGSLTLLVAASSVLMGADWGPPAGAVLLCAAAVVAVTGVMALVGAFASTSEQAGTLQTIVAVSMSIVGGTFVPIDTSAGVLATVSLVSPNAWFVRGLGDLGATGLGGALPAVGVLVLVGFLAGAIALTQADRILRP